MPSQQTSKTIVERNVAKYFQLLNDDNHRLNDSLLTKLRREGMVVNTFDSANLRPRLAPYFKRYKDELGPTLWSLLEDNVGKLT